MIKKKKSYLTTYHNFFEHVTPNIYYFFGLINIEKILNRPVTKFYSSDDVNVTAAELLFTRATSFYKKHCLL